MLLRQNVEATTAHVPSLLESTGPAITCLALHPVTSRPDSQLALVIGHQFCMTLVAAREGNGKLSCQSCGKSLHETGRELSGVVDVAGVPNENLFAVREYKFAFPLDRKSVV